MENKTGKIMIEASQDNRLEVAMEIAKSLNNLTDLLKNMETSVSNIHINGCNIQTAQGETAIYMGNNVKNTLVSNCMVDTSSPSYRNPYIMYDDEIEENEYQGNEPEEDLEDEIEEDDTYEESIKTFEKDDHEDEED